jgi:hypothetical protein
VASLALLRAALRSRRTLSVALLSFASGLPLGLVWYAIPDWMRDIGVDIRVVGLITLAQAPWAFKVVWSPLMDRYVPPFWGRRRGWMAVTQLALGGLGLLLAGVGERPEAIWVVGALAFAIAIASASQDIAIDAYAVEVLVTGEQGAAVGARLAFYRAAMVVSGGAAITLAARIGWPAVNALLALVYVPMLVLTWRSPEPAEPQVDQQRGALTGGGDAVQVCPGLGPGQAPHRQAPAERVRLAVEHHRARAEARAGGGRNHLAARGREREHDRLGRAGQCADHQGGER